MIDGCDQAMEVGQDQPGTRLVCDRPAGHDGLHYDLAANVSWVAGDPRWLIVDVGRSELSGEWAQEASDGKPSVVRKDTPVIEIREPD
jgi:hypothetical protein